MNKGFNLYTEANSVSLFMKQMIVLRWYDVLPVIPFYTVLSGMWLNVDGDDICIVVIHYLWWNLSTIIKICHLRQLNLQY